MLRTTSGLRVYDARKPDLPRVKRFGILAAIAWSSDERWLAVVRGQTVTLEGPRGRVVLPLKALDLAWTRGLA